MLLTLKWISRKTRIDYAHFIMNRVRRIVCEKIAKYAQIENVFFELEVPTKHGQNSVDKRPALFWRPDEKSYKDLERVLPQLDFNDDCVQFVRISHQTDKTATVPVIEFQLNPQSFVEAVLSRDILTANQSHFKDMHMVFDYSSPNIAKPFHVGHLRSTIIGNTLANLHQHLGYKVTKLNYLGDWGTQFGMLQVGVEMLGLTEEHMQRQPIESLYRAYVAANTAAQSDVKVLEKARSYFASLETDSDKESARKWQLYRQYTVDDLARIYARLGVHFDSYEWESQYSQNQIGTIMGKLAENGLLLDECDGRKVVQVDNRRVPLIKSDGSTLYLARDIAALVDRFHRFHFERMFYVVENGQADHFNACFKTTAALCPSQIPLHKLKHVKFGRIHGMSTRRGQVVLLQDVLDEARDMMCEKQLKSPTTKVQLNAPKNKDKGDGEDEDNNVADVLGVSAVIVNDLKQRRQRDYEFSWNKALQMNGDTGIKLQYTHCRLHSLLERNAGIDVHGVRGRAEYLNEPEAQQLIYEIARFEQSVWQAKEQLEACILVSYLFNLCNSTSRALKRLQVKDESCRVTQQQRLLLFRAAKDTLHEGMQILGLRPLNQM